MPKTASDKAHDFYRKVKNSLNTTELNSAFCKFSPKMSYKDLTTIALKALKEASLHGDTIINTSYLDSETFVAEVAQKKEKNYKLFQKVFEQKSQIFVLPAFQHLKVHLEQKDSYNGKINFFVMENKCYFSLQHVPSKIEVAFKINNLGHSKVACETIYDNQKQTITNTLEVDVNDINEKLIAKFINIITSEFDKLIK